MRSRSHQHPPPISRGTLAGLTALILVAFAIQASLGTIKPGTVRLLGEDSGTTHRQVVQSQHQHAVRAVRRQTIKPIAATLARAAERARASLVASVCEELGWRELRRARLHAEVDLPPPALV